MGPTTPRRVLASAISWEECPIWALLSRLWGPLERWGKGLVAAQSCPTAQALPQLREEHAFHPVPLCTTNLPTTCKLHILQEECSPPQEVPGSGGQTEGSGLPKAREALLKMLVAGPLALSPSQSLQPLEGGVCAAFES